MSVTNKRIDVLRRLFLGPLYGECKDNPMGVTRDKLEARLNKLKEDECVLDCDVDEMIKVCQLKSHYPLCAKDEDCIAKNWDKDVMGRFSYQQYMNAKRIENEPDTDDEEEEDENKCNICWMDEDANGEHPTHMSCGHYSHISCLIRDAQTKGIDNAKCPECRHVFTLQEVPVPVRTLEQRMNDSARRIDFNRSQMGMENLNLNQDEDLEAIERRRNAALQRLIEAGLIPRDPEERRRQEEIRRQEEERQEQEEERRRQEQQEERRRRREQEMQNQSEAVRQRYQEIQEEEERRRQRNLEIERQRREYNERHARMMENMARAEEAERRQRQEAADRRRRAREEAVEQRRQAAEEAERRRRERESEEQSEVQEYTSSGRPRRSTRSTRRM